MSVLASKDMIFDFLSYAEVLLRNDEDEKRTEKGKKEGKKKNKEGKGREKGGKGKEIRKGKRRGRGE